jgi:hypothetical protein
MSEIEVFLPSNSSHTSSSLHDDEKIEKEPNSDDENEHEKHSFEVSQSI